MGAVLVELDNPDDVNIPNPLDGPEDVHDLALFMLGVQFEIEVGNLLNFTFQALKDAGGDLSKAHRLAATAVVPDPAQVNITQMQNDLGTVHQAVQADERFAGGIALAQALVNISKTV
jgi:hypothetical protein